MSEDGQPPLRCWRCGEPAWLQLDDPARGRLGYCREDFSRLTHVEAGCAVSLVSRVRLPHSA